MAHRTKDKIFTNRTYCNFVIETIKQLYPEETFPKNLFPDLQPLLLNFFMKEINPRKEKPELVRVCSDRKQVQDLAKKILNFRNLLKEHPRMVVLIYRRCIEKFIYYKHGKTDEREDILQEVITRLMEDKIYKVRDRYDFNLKKFSTFTSYLMVTIRNIYIDIVRERNIRPLTAGELQPVDGLFDASDIENMMNRLLIEEELVKLQTIMKLYYKSRPKLELCLKLKYRVPIGKKETSRCFPGCSREDIEMLTQDFKLVKDKTMFERVVLIFNRHEDKKSKSDTIRKWIFVKIDEIISHLNRTHNADVYNRKNVGELVTLYYRYEGKVSQFPVFTSKLFLRG
ncbi:MAG: sigma-70 family RNA polymerase sigma factor [Candidatus Aminicenantes bacterium]|nr:sigma-70 family RNA polymerase sigma factor [Candidatus Aminicenantes bacterium]